MMSVLEFAVQFDWTRVLVTTLGLVLFFSLRWQIRTYHRPATPPRPRPEATEPIDLRAEALWVGPLVPWSETRFLKDEDRLASPAGLHATHGGTPHDSHRK